VTESLRVAGERTQILERRINKVCDRFEAAWRSSSAVRLEDYLEGWQGRERTALLRELVPLDVDYRRARALPYQLHEYLERFPELDTTWLANSVPPSDPAARPGGPASTAESQQRSEAADRLDPLTHYQILEEVARGGMGVVYRCQDNDLRRELAIKVLHERHAANSDLVRRFAEEAHIGGLLQHPGIVPVHAFGQLPDGRPFFTMKLIRGRTLLSQLKDRVDCHQDLPRFLNVFLQVSQALAYAHSCKVIHRDLKPANIMVGTFGEVQVMDWGLAKKLDAPASAGRTSLPDPGGPDRLSTDSASTHAGTVMGTLAYMPPEQARGDNSPLDERSDVFGLGGLLCHILTGAPPHVRSNDRNVEELAAAGDLSATFARLDACGADAELIALARDCLAPVAASRPASAGVVVTRLVSFLEARESQLRQLELDAARARARAEEQRKRRRMLASAAAAVCLACVFGGLYWWIQKSRSDARQAELTTRVEATVQQALILRGQAEASEKNRLAHYKDALAQVKEAGAMAASGGLNTALASQVQNLQAAIEREVALAGSAEKDLRFRARLREIETQTGDDLRGLDQDFPGAVARYAAAFAEYGIDPTNWTPAQLAAWTSQHDSAFATEVAAAVDDWAHASRLASRQRTAALLVQLASALDPDPWRERVRTAIQSRDLPAMRLLSLSSATWEAPPSTLHLLAVNLAMRGNFWTQRFPFQKGSPGKPPPRGTLAFTYLSARLSLDSGFLWGAVAATASELGLVDDIDLAETLLRRAQLRYPDHFQLNHSLGWLLLYRQKETAAALPFVLASLARRPQSAAAWRNLIDLHEINKDQEAMLASLQEFMRRRPLESWPHARMANLRLRQHDWDRAADSMARALTLNGPVAYAEEMAFLLVQAKDAVRARTVLLSGHIPVALQLEIAFTYACLLLRDGHDDDYRDLCLAMANSASRSWRDAHLYSRLTALGLNPGLERSAQIRFASSAASQLSDRGYVLHTLALNYFREGAFAKAEQILRDAPERASTWMPGLNQVLMAMILQKQNKSKAAKVALAQGIRTGVKPGDHMHDRWAFVVLRREAERLLATSR
jgi:serine/threonine protein kinase